MAWPQITIIILMAMNVGMNIAKHGEPRKDSHFNVFWALANSGITAGILYASGFFS